MRDRGMSETTVFGVHCNLLQNTFKSNRIQKVRGNSRNVNEERKHKSRAVYDIHHILSWNMQVLIFFRNCII